jgi:ankyrin repeat protein
MILLPRGRVRDHDGLAALLSTGMLLKAEAKHDTYNQIGALEQAVLDGKIDAVRQLLERGANPNVPMRQVLAESISNGHDEITILLLDHGADPNLVTPNGGVSPLMEAASRGKVLIMRALIQKGADVNYDDHVGGGTALNLAVEGSRLEAVRLLLEAGADASLSGKFHDYPWKAARRLKDRAMLDLLRQHTTNCRAAPEHCR